MFFLPFFKYHVLFEDQLENCIGDDDMIDMFGVNVLLLASLPCFILCSKNFITENNVKITFPIPGKFPSLRIVRFISENTN